MTRRDPVSDSVEAAWLGSPALLLRGFALAAAARAGFLNFVPDACLLNRYLPGARLSLHQDRDECDFHAPIVSVPLGLPAATPDSNGLTAITPGEAPN